MTKTEDEASAISRVHIEQVAGGTLVTPLVQDLRENPNARQLFIPKGTRGGITIATSDGGYVHTEINS